MTLRVGMVYDLRDDYLREGFTEEQVAEFDSVSTIEAIEAAIRERGDKPERIGHGRSLCRRLAGGDRWDLVFSIAEGVQGRSREAQVPALLEMFELPYTFSDPLVCAVTLDKAITKRIVGGHDIATPRFALVERPEDIDGASFRYPLFVKPVAEGTGKGVDARSRAGSPEALREVCSALLPRFPQGILVEEYLPGREFTTGVLGSGRKSRVLGTMEIRMRATCAEQDYSYDVKERCEELVDYLPLEAGVLRREVEAMALGAHRALQCRDASRVDIRLDGEGRPSFLEINPLPGLHPSHSDLPMIATQEGMPYPELIGSIIDSALERAAGAPRGT